MSYNDTTIPDDLWFSKASKPTEKTGAVTTRFRSLWFWFTLLWTRFSKQMTGSDCLIVSWPQFSTRPKSIDIMGIIVCSYDSVLWLLAPRGFINHIWLNTSMSSWTVLNPKPHKILGIVSECIFLSHLLNLTWIILIKILVTGNEWTDIKVNLIFILLSMYHLVKSMASQYWPKY